MCEEHMESSSPSKRLRISELNPHLLCALCGGYLVDATTIIECLHSFCRTCIVKYLEASKYCPICEVLIHKTRPWQNIRLDHALQNVVYKMVPGLFQSEMRRRREFYEKGMCNDDKHGLKNLLTNDMIGSRIIFSHDEEFSISIQFSPNGKPVPEAGNKSLKRQTNYKEDKRYLKCPAALRVTHLKKFIRSKFSLPGHIMIDMFHIDEPLSDSFSLMDVAYIYMWKRDCVLQLYYSFFQTPPKREPVETITKTVAEKVKEKHEVKGRERERAEREKEDQNRAAAKKEKDKTKETRQGKMYGKKEVLSSSVSHLPNSAQSVRPSDGKQQQAAGASKRKPSQGEYQTLSSPSPDKKQKKASPISKTFTNGKNSNSQSVSPAKASLKRTGAAPQEGGFPKTRSPRSLSLSCRPVSDEACDSGNTEKGPTPPKMHRNSFSGCLSVSQMDATRVSSTNPSSSQNVKFQTASLVMSDKSQQSSTRGTMTTSNQQIQTEDADLAHSRKVVSSLHSSVTSSVSVNKGSQCMSPCSTSKSQALPLTITVSNNYASTASFAPSNVLYISNSNPGPKCISINSLETVSVPESDGQNSSITIQSRSVGYPQSSLLNKTAVASKQLRPVVTLSNMEVDQHKQHQTSPLVEKTISPSQNVKLNHSNSPITVINAEMNHQDSALAGMMNTNKSLHHNAPPTSSAYKTTKPSSLNTPLNIDPKISSSSTLTVVSPSVKQAPDSTALVNVQAGLNNNNNNGHPTHSLTFNKSNSQDKRKPTRPLPSSSSKPMTPGSHEQHNLPSPLKEDTARACEDRVPGGDKFSSSTQSNHLFQRMDRLVKMAESEAKDGRFSAGPLDVSTDVEHLDRQSPTTNVSQNSPAAKSSGCDDVELISVEFIDSPKKSSDQTRCDDSVQSLKSDDSGVATTIEIEDDCLDLTPKGPSPSMSASPSPGHSLASPVSTSIVSCTPSQLSCTTDFEKSRYSPSVSSQLSVMSETNRDTPPKTCSSQVTSSHATTTASMPLEYSKPSSLFINSSCQTTETGSMTVESSLMFSARNSPIVISEQVNRTMLKIPKDYNMQPTDLSTKSGRDGSPSSPDSGSKLTLCLPVSHLSKPTLKLSSTTSGECNVQSQSPRSVTTNVDCMSANRAQIKNNINSTSKESLQCQSKPKPCMPGSPLVSFVSSTQSKVTSTSAADFEAAYLGFALSNPSIVSSSMAHSKCPTTVTSAPYYYKMSKDIVTTQQAKTMQEGFIPKLTITNDSLKSATVSRKNSSSSEPASNKVPKQPPSFPGMGKNIVSSTKSTQPLKLTVTLSSGGEAAPVRVSPTTIKEPKRTDQRLSQTSKSSKSHTVARIIAPSSSPSPPPSPTTTRVNNTIIQTTKISTLIPKSSSISSKSNSFSKQQFPYPANINTVPSPRSFLPNALSHPPHADMVGLARSPMEKNTVLSSYHLASSSSSLSPSPSSSTPISSNASHHHKTSTSSSKHKDRGDNRADKSGKVKTIPPLSIPKSCLISPPLKLQRSPGSTDHYIFTHQNPYLTSTANSHSGEGRQRTKESSSRHSGNSTPTSPPSSSSSSKEGQRQRVPSIKISDINRNPIIVESGNNNNNNNTNDKNSRSSHGQNTNHHHHHHRSHSHTSSRSENGSSGRHRSGSSSGSSSSTHSPNVPIPSTSSLSSSLSSAPRPIAVAKEHPRRPTSSEILFNTSWHMHTAAAAEFFLHHPSFKLAAAAAAAAAGKFPNLHYDTDAMPLDYSQSSSKL